MSAIVRGDQHALTMVQAQAQALDLALRAAATLKNARGLLPEALKSEGEIVAVLLAGQELGIQPMAALRGMQVVKGKIVISYDLMIGLLRRAGYRIEWLTATATEATLRLTAPDKTTHTETWNEGRARKAGLWGAGTWGKYPDTMLRARCVSSAARAFAGEVLAGVYCEESGEGEEIAGPRVVGIRDHASRGEVIDAEAIVDPPTPPRAVKPKLSECETTTALADWIARAGRKAYGLKPADTVEKVSAQAMAVAERMGMNANEADVYVRGALEALGHVEQQAEPDDAEERAARDATEG